jgi:circadian clock protein KaiB
MKDKLPLSASEQTRLEFERLLSTGPGQDHYVLVLYVTGSTRRSAQAVATIRALCEEHLAGNYELEVIDIYQNPERLASDQIIAAPTLFKKEPMPSQRIVGNLADPERVMVGLNLKSQADVNWIEL